MSGDWKKIMACNEAAFVATREAVIKFLWRLEIPRSLSMYASVAYAL